MMMRWLPLTLAALAALAATAAVAAPAAPAPEPTVFTVFRTICGAHQGDLKAAEAEARKQGFVLVPPPADADPASLVGHTVLKRDSADLPLVVFLTQAPDTVLDGAPNAEATLCGVSGADPAGAAAAAARAWVGLEASSQDGNHTTWLYRQTGVQRLLLADEQDATIKAAIAASEFRVFDIDSEAEGVNLGLMSGMTRAPAKP